MAAGGTRMGHYKPPKDGESDAEFWQRLREMARTMERDSKRQGSGDSAKNDIADWPKRRSHKRVGAPGVVVDLSKYIDDAG